MCSARDDAALPTPGLPIRKSTGQRLFSASPWLIAAVHVLHRLLVPRHPPRALHILTVISSDPTSRRTGTGDTHSSLASYAVFKVRRGAHAAGTPRRAVSQNSAVRVQLESCASPRFGRRTRNAGMTL